MQGLCLAPFPDMETFTESVLTPFLNMETNKVKASPNPGCGNSNAFSPLLARLHSLVLPGTEILWLMCQCSGLRQLPLC